MAAPIPAVIVFWEMIVIALILFLQLIGIIYILTRGGENSRPWKTIALLLFLNIIIISLNSKFEFINWAYYGEITGGVTVNNEFIESVIIPQLIGFFHPVVQLSVRSLINVIILGVLIVQMLKTAKQENKNIQELMAKFYIIIPFIAPFMLIAIEETLGTLIVFSFYKSKQNWIKLPLVGILLLTKYVTVFFLIGELIMQKLLKGILKEYEIKELHYILIVLVVFQLGWIDVIRDTLPFLIMLIYEGIQIITAKKDEQKILT